MANSKSELLDFLYFPTSMHSLCLQCTIQVGVIFKKVQVGEKTGTVGSDSDLV